THILALSQQCADFKKIDAHVHQLKGSSSRKDHTLELSFFIPIIERWMLLEEGFDSFMLHFCLGEVVEESRKFGALSIYGKDNVPFHSIR
ncbi:hypothetical protein MKX01_032122, partial [Papaver californicum]